MNVTIHTPRPDLLALYHEKSKMLAVRNARWISGDRSDDLIEELGELGADLTVLEGVIKDQKRYHDYCARRDQDRR